MTSGIGAEGPPRPCSCDRVGDRWGRSGSPSGNSVQYPGLQSLLGRIGAVHHHGPISGGLLGVRHAGDDAIGHVVHPLIRVSAGGLCVGTKIGTPSWYPPP